MSFDYLCGLCKENNYVKIDLDKKIIGSRIKQLRDMKNLRKSLINERLFFKNSKASSVKVQ